MNSTVSTFIKNYYTDGVFHTHVSMISPLGKFQLNKEAQEKLLDLYCKFSEEEILSSEVLGIAEKPTEYLPIIADFDIKLSEDEALDLRSEVYSENQIKKVVEIYQSVLRNILKDCTDENLICVFLEKPRYSVTSNGHKYFKRGFHLHFPYIFLNKDEQKIHLIPRVKNMLKEFDVFAEIGIEDSSKLLDDDVITKPWLMYGSRKDINMKPYLLSKIYDSSTNEISINDAFKNYKLYDFRERRINITDREIYYLPRILSIIPSNREINDLRFGLLSPLQEEKRLSTTRKEIKNLKTSVADDLKIAKELLPMLADFRCVEYKEWIYIGWILYNIGEGCDEARELWLDFSARCEDKFDEGKCLDEWDKMTKKNCSIASLIHFAKKDSPEKYEQFKKEQGQQYVKNALEGSHYDIAKLLYAEYCTEFVCASVTNKTWYQFVEHHWEEVEEGVFLREKISSEIVLKFAEEGGKCFQKQALAIENSEENNQQQKIKQIQKTIHNLKTNSFKKAVMNEAVDIFYNKNFKTLLDSNPYMIGFKNGVYDLKENMFRPGRPEDYISKKMPINYYDFDEKDDRVFAVHDFLEKVFPDVSVRQYFLTNASDVFVGGNHQKIVLFWLGEGDNGKSVTQSIMERMLGEYAIKFSTTLLTGKKTSNGSANPELARAGGGVRWAVLEEPDADEQLNIGYLKSLSGDDTFWCRDLFEKGKGSREIRPMFKINFICNKLLKLRSSDKATWNRIRVLPFESTFVKPNDPNLTVPSTYEEQLKEKLFPMDREFSKKIPDLLEPFCWVLLEHRKKVLQNPTIMRIEPEKVRIATAIYQKENDVYRQYIEETIITCDKGVAGSVSLGEIYQSFKSWLKDGFPNNVMPVKNDIKDYLTKLWFEPTNNVWNGYKFKKMDDVINNVNEDENKNDNSNVNINTML